MEENNKKKSLPRFRRDLELYPGPDDPDGSPTFNLYDPIKSQYFKINWTQSLIMKNLSSDITIDALIDKIHTTTTIKVSFEEIQHFFNHAGRLGLLELPKSSAQVNNEYHEAKVHPLKWLLFHYLYFRIPICNPDLFLEKTLPFVKPLASPFAFLIYIIIAIIGVFQIFIRFDEYIHTFPYFFSLKGFLIFGIAMTLTKIIHELGHAYTAKNYKIHVTSMGAAFLVLWPVLYTDVTDGWRLPDRKKRFAISAAGVVVELVLAGISSLAWAITSPGVLQSIFFILSSVTWISTLLVNVNPCMRFDGYYLLSDLWGIDNMQNRSFAIARWKLRKMFLGLDVPPPESGLKNSRISGMVIYSICTWIYRLFLYTAIAVLVYVTFTKVLGIFLFLLEICVFIIWPITSEIKQLFKLRKSFKLNFRLTGTIFLFLIFSIWFITPMSHYESYPGITTPSIQQILYVPFNGKVEQIFVHKNQFVREGEDIIKIESKELENQIHVQIANMKLLQQQIHILALEDQDHSQLPEKESELAGIIEHLRGLITLEKDLTLKSKINGLVYSWDNHLHPEQNVYQDQFLGKIANTSQVNVICFVPENEVEQFSVGEDVEFFSKNQLEYIPGKVVHISPTTEQKLEFEQLSSTNRGDLAVKEGKDGELYLVDANYPVEIALDVGLSKIRFGVKGFVKIKGKKRSKLSKGVKKIKKFLIQESAL